MFRVSRKFSLLDIRRIMAAGLGALGRNEDDFDVLNANIKTVEHVDADSARAIIAQKFQVPVEDVQFDGCIVAKSFLSDILVELSRHDNNGSYETDAELLAKLEAIVDSEG